MTAFGLVVLTSYNCVQNLIYKNKHQLDVESTSIPRRFDCGFQKTNNVSNKFSLKALDNARKRLKMSLPRRIPTTSENFKGEEPFAAKMMHSRPRCGPCFGRATAAAVAAAYHNL